MRIFGRISAVLAAGLLALPAASRADALDDIAKAMGADKIKTIEYSGAGSFYALGQPETPSSAWPRYGLAEYRITANYETASMIQDWLVTFGDMPRRGGGRPPANGHERRISAISGDTGWSYRGKTASPSRGTSDLKHTLWLSPHGVVKAAQAQKAEVKMRKAGGKEFRTVTIAGKGAFRAAAWFDTKTNRLRGVDSIVANPVYGDMPVKTVYSGYKSFGGVMFPTRIRVSSAGFPTLDVAITAVKANAPADIAPPADMRRGGGRVTMEKAAEGVWFVAGGSHNSVAIEMKDHVLLVEAPLGDGRTKAVLREVRKTIPGKPVRTVLNTHLHFDHSGGLRAAASEGISIATFKDNVALFQAAYAGKDTLRQDAYAKAKKKAKFIAMGDKHVFSDGARTVEMHRLIGNAHNNGLYVVYLPKEKILSVADAYSARSLVKAPVKKVDPFTANLWENLMRLKLDVEKVLPIHGKMVEFDQLKLTAGQQP
jgi:glyoxylase-like metal-dependent hydrolase (beta-lactamase superfamily II)